MILSEFVSFAGFLLSLAFTPAVARLLLIFKDAVIVSKEQ